VWTDFWLSIAVIGCSLIGVSAGEEQARKVFFGGPLGVEQTSRLGSRDPVDDRVKCGLHGKDEVVDGFLVEPQNQGRAGTTWWSSHEWRLARGYTESVGFTLVRHKTIGFRGRATKLRPKTRRRRGGNPGRSNRPTQTAVVVWSWQTEGSARSV
jgi:hypothetical protein